MKRRIKWVNVMIAIVFIVSSFYILNTLFILATSLSSLTYFGVVTTLLALIMADFSLEYLIDEWQ